MPQKYCKEECSDSSVSCDTKTNAVFARPTERCMKYTGQGMISVLLCVDLTLGCNFLPLALDVTVCVTFQLELSPQG
jgi:hypothetical protein